MREFSITERLDRTADDMLRVQALLYDALAQLDAESKANFNPNQRRVPAGFAQGGEWTDGGSGSWAPRAPAGQRWRPVPRPLNWSGIEAGFADASEQTRRFLARNRRSIERALGGLQAVFGIGQMVGGVTAGVGGVATSEIGIGVFVAGVGGWMVSNGYDNFNTGWRALLTGAPQETDLHASLRRLGLSDDEATATEILLGGGADVGAARLGRRGLERAAHAGLEARALRIWARDPLSVSVSGRPLWRERSIKTRGLAWEAYDAQRTGFRRLPDGFPVFDQINAEGTVAISNKVIDLTGISYSRIDGSRLFSRMASQIDAVRNFRTATRVRQILDGRRLTERRLHILLPAGESLPGQALQIAAAEQYALRRGVVLQVEYAR